MRSSVRRRKAVKVGDLVSLKGRKHKATVVGLLSDVPGGVVLDRPLGGCHCWNEADLERTRPSRKARNV